MNEAILKWLACVTIGMVACGSLWLAGTVQKDLNGGPLIVGHAQAVPQQLSHRRDIHLAARPAERAASAVAVRAAYVLE